MKLPVFYIDKKIKEALREDINYIDITSDYLIPQSQRSKARLIAKEKGILCGLDIALRVFELLDATFEFKTSAKDGDQINPGDTIAEIQGPTLALLKGERTALNFIQHLSGIATTTRAAAKAVEGIRATIADTRKTLPGLRAMQKYAVMVGGGKNHRFNLSDCAMIKDNHIDACGSISKAVETLRDKLGHTAKIEVETRTLSEVEEAVDSGADIIMLDNMDLDTMRRAVEIASGRALLEASGGVSLDNIRAIAETGVDIISMGALTHSVKALDISLKIEK